MRYYLIMPVHKDIQVEFLNSIKESFKSPKDFIATLENVLNIERSSVYNRLNGYTRLTIDEMLEIMKHFKPQHSPLTDFWPTAVTVEYPAMMKQPESFLEYLTPVRDNLRQVVKAPDRHLTYAANEMPFLHYLRYPELACFKYYVWSHFIWHPQGKKSPFDHAFITSTKGACLPMINEITQLFNDIPTTEIWHTNVLNNTINQLEYINTIGLLPDKSVGRFVLDQLLELLGYIEDSSSEGYKMDIDGRIAYSLYHNEVSHTNNLVVVHASGSDIVFFAYDNPNFMVSREANLCRHTITYINNLMANSTNLTLTSTKLRGAFFKMLRDQVQKTNLD